MKRRVWVVVLPSFVSTFMFVPFLLTDGLSVSRSLGSVVSVLLQRVVVAG